MNSNHDTKQPPAWASRLLRWSCDADLFEEIQGDMLEEFNFQLQHHGVKHARREYVRTVIGFIKPFARKRKPAHAKPLLPMNMLAHYFTVAFRNLIRHKSFSLINVAGLSLGMSCCLCIMLWVQDERQVDNFHANGDRLFSVYTKGKAGGNIFANHYTPLALGTTKGALFLTAIAGEIKKTIPEIKYAAHYATGYELPWGHPETFQIGEKKFKLEGSRASEDFFKMFSFPLLAGDASTALKDISSIAISKKMSDMFFDNPQQAIGKAMRFENNLDLVVTAVFADVPANSSLKFDYLINWIALQNGKVNTSSNFGQIYVQLADNANAVSAEEKVNHFLDGRVDKDAGYTIALALQPFGETYLISDFENGVPSGGRIAYVKIFSGAAIFILLMACVNFMNLATARSVKRAKEVGVRKVVGSSRAYLILQFFGESMLISCLALGVSVLLILIILPAFNDFTGKQIELPFRHLSLALLFLPAMVFLTGLVAGSYPALFLSSLKPVKILKGAVRFTPSAVFLRKGLAVFQFVLSIALLIATIVVTQQTRFVQNTNIGYNRENLVYIRVEGDINNKYASFKQSSVGMPGIGLVDRSSEAPHNMGFVTEDAINWEGKPASASVGFKPTSVGFDFIRLMNLQVAEGREFSKDFVSDTAAFMVNQEAVKQMGMKDPIGKWISAWNKKGIIIGILKDYHTNSLREPIQPLIVDVKENLDFGVIIVRLEAGKTKEGLNSLETLYKQFNPDYPFAFQFVDEEYGKLYRTEQTMASLSNAFAAVAIMISCLGLLGLVMFSAEQRVKEIGIRKVLGANAGGIVALLSVDFIRIVALSFLIAAPVSGYFMHEWLSHFTYKINLSWWIFAVAGISTLLLALLTISIQAIRSATANPVKSLRTE